MTKLLSVPEIPAVNVQDWTKHLMSRSATIAAGPRPPG